MPRYEIKVRWISQWLPYSMYMLDLMSLWTQLNLSLHCRWLYWDTNRLSRDIVQSCSLFSCSDVTHIHVLIDTSCMFTVFLPVAVVHNYHKYDITSHSLTVWGRFAMMVNHWWRQSLKNVPLLEKEKTHCDGSLGKREIFQITSKYWTQDIWIY